MEKEIHFILCKLSVLFNKRYQLNFEDVNTNFQDNIETRNRRYNKILDAILQPKKQEILYRNSRFIVFSKSLGEKLVRLDIGKKEEVKKPGLDESGFVEKIDEEYPNFHVYFHRETQDVIIERNFKVLSTEMALINIVNEYIRLFYNQNELEAIISPKFVTASFWDIVENEDYLIRKVEFELFAPNFMGAVNSAKELAKKMRDKNNAERVKFILISENGVIISKNDAEMGSYVDYTSQGCGLWNLTAKNKKTGKNVNLKTKKTIKKVKTSITFTEEGYVVEINKINEMVKNEEDNL